MTETMAMAIVVLSETLILLQFCTKDYRQINEIK